MEMFYRSPPRVLAPRRPATRTPMPGSSAFLGSPGLPVRDDWECRLWEETTIFIVWIKYFSWPSCYLLSVVFFFLFPHSPSFLPSSLPPSLSPSLSFSHSLLSNRAHWEKFRGESRHSWGGKSYLKESKQVTEPFAILIPRPALPKHGALWSKSKPTLF